MSIHNKTMKLISNMANEYKPDAMKSLKDNAHMNDLKGDEVITPEDINTIIDTFVAACKVKDANNISDKGALMEYLKDVAISIRSTFTNKPMLQTVIDAVLVDFCIFNATKQWIDYALYASDLAKEEKKAKKKAVA